MHDESNKDNKDPAVVNPTTLNQPWTIHPDFINPYRSMRKNEDYWHRFTLDVDGRDIGVIKSTLVRHGAIQTTINLVIHALSTYARTNELSYTDERQFEQHILDVCEFARKGGYIATKSGPTPSGPSNNPPGRPSENTNVGDGRTTTPTVRANNEGETDVTNPKFGEQTDSTGTKSQKGESGGVRSKGNKKGK